MKKNATFLLAMLMLAMAMARNVNLTFTGRMTDGSYIRLDSVKVENLSREWTEMLTWPDTTLTISVTGINHASNSNAGLSATRILSAEIPF